MKRIFFLAFFLVALFVLGGCSSRIIYSCKPSSGPCCEIEYCAQKLDSTLFINVIVRSENLVFREKPEMWVKNNGGKVLSLTGEKVNAGDASFSGYYETAAMFSIRIDDVEFFRSGIQRIKLTMFPAVHDWVFSWDERLVERKGVGQRLYKQLLKFV